MYEEKRCQGINPLHAHMLGEIENKLIPPHAIEQKITGTSTEDQLRRAVEIRRSLLGIGDIPWAADMQYSAVYGRCCENVVGYVPIPVGVVVGALIDGKYWTIPMATTEGALVASTQRGFKAILQAGDNGVQTHVHADGMTRAPIVHFEKLSDAIALKDWIGEPKNFSLIENVFNATSSYARLVKVDATICGTDLFLRFKATTGDAMGMNMLSKGCEQALIILKEKFPKMKIISLSGNYCTDKKAAALNWIDGRGKSVVAMAMIPAHIVATVLHVSVADLVDASIKKNFKGSALAGAIGGFNAQAANIVSAIFIATGQDPAQAVVSSSCLTEMEELPDGSLKICCSMPSLEVGTIGGGTHLRPQQAALEMLGIAGPTPQHLPYGEHARSLARIICATVLAAELSLMASLVQGTLTEAHLVLNRSKIGNRSSSEGTLSH